MLLFYFFFYINLLFPRKTNEDLIISCKLCGEKITTFQNIKKINTTKYRIIKENKTNYTDVFQNSYGKLFEVLTFDYASLTCSNQFFEEESFYKGYSWSICQCSKCGAHQGWLFLPLDKYCVDNKDEYTDEYNQCKNRQFFYGITTDNIQINEEKERISEYIEF